MEKSNNANRQKNTPKVIDFEGFNLFYFSIKMLYVFYVLPLV